MITRWKYRFICWFFDRPDALARRVAVENVLADHAARGVPLPPARCREMALKLGVPTGWRL